MLSAVNQPELAPVQVIAFLFSTRVARNFVIVLVAVITIILTSFGPFWSLPRSINLLVAIISDQAENLHIDTHG